MTYNGWNMSDEQATRNLIDRGARALLASSYVALGDRERVFEDEFLADLHPADVAFILDSDCVCRPNFAGTDVVEFTCERCRLEQYRQDVPFDLESER